MVQKILQQLKLPFLIFIIIIIIGSVLLTVTYLETKQKKPDILTLQKNTQSQRGVVNEVSEDAIGIDPKTYLTTWNFNNLPDQERKKYYRETKQEDGSLLREYWIHAEDKEIEIAPGVFFPAWSYNGQVPGPSIRATEGDKIKIYFENRGTKPHSLHFHGFHDPAMDGSMPEQVVLPGQSFTYEFVAEPFGVHLYHCHGFPVAQHIHKGLYGVYIVDPLPEKDTRPKPDKELIMLMNGFDTNFDEENEIYAVNSIAFYYDKNPIKIKADELVRIYLVNMLEFDQINSFHVHANFFNEYKTGTRLTPDGFTDITVLGQGERSILDLKFKYPGMYMFHAHKTEFAEKGWMGNFEVLDNNQNNNNNNNNIKHDTTQKTNDEMYES